jgi:hypothetical protein
MLEAMTAETIKIWNSFQPMSLIDRIVGAESGGDAYAKNPRSSASGLGQFIDSTWLEMLAKHRPDLKGSPQELLALKSDPAISRAMTEAYATDNGAVLSGAGLPVNPGTTYLAHFAGPQGAIKVLQADPNAPIEGILGAKAVAANPFLKGKTAGDVAAWAARKMGGAQPQPSLQPAPATPAGPLQAIPSPAPPIFPQATQQQAQQQQAPQDYFAQMPADMGQPPPIFAPPRKPIDLRALRAALARPTGGLFLGKA